jgi:hypothetical protein
MASPAAAYSNGERRRYRVDWRIMVAIVIQALLLVFSYGRLTQRVDDLHDQIQGVHQDIRELRQDLKK